MSRHRIVCAIDGRSVLPENWHNHALGDGPHEPTGEGVNGLSVEETALLDRLDELDDEPLGGRGRVRDRIADRLLMLAEGSGMSRDAAAIVANIRAFHQPILEGSGGTGNTPTTTWNGPYRADGSAWPCDAEYAARLLADTPLVEPLVDDGDGGRWKGIDGEGRAIRPSVEPGGLAEVQSALSWALGRIDKHPLTASELLEAAAALLPTQASDSPEKTT